MNLLEQMNSLNVCITRLVTDSRKVLPGDTFVACPGEKLDGRQFIAQAIAHGANAVLWESQNFAWNDAWTIPNLGVSDLRHKLGQLADEVNGKPSGQLQVIGVTGTNGKTSTSHWIAQALGYAGRKCALIGTLGNGFAGELQPGMNTTPDAISVHGLFAEYLKQGAAAVAMEVSSHALAQGRVNGVRFDIALLTNLSRDHLDYHGDMESYAASKRKLFNWNSLRCAVLNLDDAFGASLAAELCGGKVEIIGYGMTDTALKQAEGLGIRMVYGRLTGMSARGIDLKVHSSWGGVQLVSGLLGRFNAENLLGVLAVLLASGVPMEGAVQSLGGVQPVAGRMQRLGDATQPTVVVDYAHTPDALEKVLQTLREVNAEGDTREECVGGCPEAAPPPFRRLICVFGCGGDRDRGKRAMMGKVAGKYADRCIVTSDNPRSENPESIIAEIVSGMDAQNREIIVDRAAAIEYAIKFARSCDTVLIAGKGHENYQEIAGIRHPFSDVEVAMRTLKDWRAA